MNIPEPTPSSFEVAEPILNSPFNEPREYWYIREGEQPERRQGRRRSIVFPPRTQKSEWDLSDGTLVKAAEYPGAYEMVLVNQIRERVSAWRKAGYPGATRTTLELLAYWNRDGRHRRLFFTQREAAETIIFLTEARHDFRQGITVPLDTPNNPFIRYACKMATGSGKSTVMAMLAAWSILNKVTDRSDARFSDVVLVVCPNVTIRSRLGEIDPEQGQASLYRTRDLVPEALMPQLRRGRVLIMNWHVFELQDLQGGAKVVKTGVPYKTKETLKIGPKTTTARGSRIISQSDLELQIATGQIAVVGEVRDKDGVLKAIEVEAIRYRESETAWVRRLFEKEIGGKQNILLLNDEAHHAYRIRPDENFEDEDEDDEGYEKKEATVWIEGLDRLHKHRGINFCVDLSATPYFLGRVGQDANRPFAWVVSDFGLVDAIESGLVKIPQLATRDTSGNEIPHYFRVWDWIMEQLTSAEKGGKKGSPKPEAVLKYAHTPIAMLAGLWEELKTEWSKGDDPRPPVFILVCKNTKIAKVIHEWLANDICPLGIPSAGIADFRNYPEKGILHTLRVDSKVIHETDSEEAKSDEARWLRYTLDMVGKREWPRDSQGNQIYPEEFKRLAEKLKRPLDPPGRDIRCIVSVGMLTEGWDCNTVTHIVGLRPFQSQLLCEQVVGRGLRRASYEPNNEGKFDEEVAKVFGVPFEIIPFKADPKGGSQKREKRYHVHAVPEKAAFEIRFPRVEGYTRAIRNRITVDWAIVPSLELDPSNIPPEVEVKGALPNNAGRLSLSGPGKIENLDLNPYRSHQRVQQLVFDMARALTKHYSGQENFPPAHVLFPQFLKIVERYVREKVKPIAPAMKVDVALSPYYGWAIETLLNAVRPDTSRGEEPELPKVEANRGMGSTAEVDYWTSREPREVRRSHLNYVVPDTQKWEQSAAYYIDSHTATDAFVKNAGLGFAIPYFDNGEPHEYIPDFIVRLKGDGPRHIILETKGYDVREQKKIEAAERWVNAVNASGKYGKWAYRLIKKPEDAIGVLEAAASER